MQIKKPYYAVIFSSRRTDIGHEEYEIMASRMAELSEKQSGFLGIESVRGADGFGITVSYWETEENIKAWKSHAEHIVAQERGRSEWYKSFTTRVCKVEREYGLDPQE